MNSEKILHVLVDGFLERQKNPKKDKKEQQQSFFEGLARRKKSSRSILGTIGGTLHAYDEYKKTLQLSEELAENPPPGESSTSPIRGIDYDAADLVDRSSAAIRIIQVMIAAAHADGTLDDEERKRIVKQMKRSGIKDEEEFFILGEMEHPRSVDELAEGVTEPQLKQMMYLMAAMPIVADTVEEVEFLSDLGLALALSDQEVATLNARLQTGK